MNESTSQKVTKGERKGTGSGRKKSAAGKKTSSAGKCTVRRKDNLSPKTEAKVNLPVGASAFEAGKTGMTEEEVNLTIGICPYFKQDRGGGRLSCEGACFRFPDKLARREYVYRFCAHPEGYKDCPLQVALNHYYERKYANHE